MMGSGSSCWPLRYLRIVWALRVTITGFPFLYAPSAATILARTSSRRDIQLLPECVWRRSAWNAVLQLCAADAAVAGDASSESSFELDGNDATTTTPLTASTTRTVPPLLPDKNGSAPTTSAGMMIHHTALHTRNISTAILFYTTLLDFQVACRFRAGPARAAWLQQQSNSSSSSCSRLELIEVPPYLWPPTPTSDGDGDTRPLPRAPDILAKYPTWLGYHHLALDVTSSVQAFKEKQTANSSSNNDTMSLLNGSDTATGIQKSRRPHLWLHDWLEQSLQARSRALYNKTIRVAVPPRQQVIGNAVYELALIYDADGCLVELLYQSGVVVGNATVSSGWEPWNGTNFQQ
jgi:catechol 2,3-dioxygenase-like lactoylglutathione lyase family enzyme